MTTLLSPANSNYLLDVDLGQLHTETIEWLSEIEFWETELNFLTKLLDKSFLFVKGSDNLSQFTTVDTEIILFRAYSLKKIHNEVIVHERNLSTLDEKLFSQNDQILREEHKELKEEINEFLSSFKKIKKTIFDLVANHLKGN